MSAALSFPAPAGQPRTRILVADDSVVVRGLVSKWLQEAGFDVVGTVSNGRAAVDSLDKSEPDILLLDIEMPELDGLAALPLALAKRPSLQVVMMSTLTQRNADISLKCLALGAVDYLPKPDSNRSVTVSVDFRQDLVTKMRGLGAARPRRSFGGAAPATGTTAAPAAPAAKIEPLRRAPARRLAGPPKVLLVGASTGGPKAVGEFLAGVGAATLRRVPVLIVQHMPPVFTGVFAEHLAARIGLPAAEGRHGEILKPGTVYVAPGGRHMGVERAGEGIAIKLSDGPPVNFCRPAVDVLFRDAAAVFGGATVSVVLTGMGSDGMHGAEALVAAGGPVLAQDEATSTVWGMPGAVAKAGLAQDILPLPALGPAVRALLGGA
jgi:two-component system, chemotaxis family, protein-glutamate methylesterase/glutaminase